MRGSSMKHLTCLTTFLCNKKQYSTINAMFQLEVYIGAANADLRKLLTEREPDSPFKRKKGFKNLAAIRHTKTFTHNQRTK